MRGQGRPAFESAIPLILIAILAVFIAGRVGIIDLHSIPLIGSLFPAPYLKVAVIGHSSPALRDLLTSEDYRNVGITYAGDFPPDVIIGGVTKNFDVLILQGSDTCDIPARREIGARIKSGGKLIVIKQACTRVTDDPNAYGWDITGDLGDVIPARPHGLYAHNRIGTITQPVSGQFKIISQDHPMFAGLLNHGFDGEITNVDPTANADVLAYVSQVNGNQISSTVYAILENHGFILSGGKTLYFAFDPAPEVPEDGDRLLLMKAILYLRGAKP